METLVDRQVQKMTEKLDFEQRLLTGEKNGEEEEDETEDDAIEVQSDDQENVGSNQTVVIN